VSGAPGGLVRTAAGAGAPAGRRFYGLAVGQVVANVDTTGGARVQVSLPWLPGFEPWARVAVPLAGDDRGTFMIPQVDDEVLVGFEHGDVRQPYVIGSLWNGRDRPPAPGPTDAGTKLIVRTRAGHEIELDDTAQSVTISTATDQTVTLEPGKVELATAGGTAKVTLGTKGDVTLEGSVSITLKAPSVSIQGTTVDVKADSAATVKGSAMVEVQGGVVKVN
jgi:uncharacterized protein involved in type VI secretion and phage assembly